MKPPGRRGALAAGGALVAAASGGLWFAVRARDRRAVERDPEHEHLTRALEPRAFEVTARDGTILHAECFGPDDAPTVVLVHGWTCGINFWTRQIQDLSGRFRVIAYDLRGHGESETPHGDDFSIQTLGDDLQAVLEAVEAPAPALLVGHSLGAMSIVSWANRHRDTVADAAAGVALLNTGLGDLISESLLVKTPSPLRRIESVVGAALLGLRAPLPPASPITNRAVRYIALSPDASPAQVAFVQDMVLNTRREVRAGCGRTLSELDLTDAVEHVSVPALVLVGRRDRLTPPAHGERLADTLPDVIELVEVERVGHMAPIEAPGAVTEAIERLADRVLERPVTEAAS